MPPCARTDSGKCVRDNDDGDGYFDMSHAISGLGITVRFLSHAPFGIHFAPFEIPLAAFWVASVKRVPYYVTYNTVY